MAGIAETDGKQNVSHKKTNRKMRGMNENGERMNVHTYSYRGTF